MESRRAEGIPIDDNTWAEMKRMGTEAGMDAAALAGGRGGARAGVHFLPPGVRAGLAAGMNTITLVSDPAHQPASTACGRVQSGPLSAENLRICHSLSLSLGLSCH